MVFSIRSRKTFKDNDGYMGLSEEDEYNDLKKYRSTSPQQQAWLNNLQDRLCMGGLSVLAFYLRTKTLSHMNFISDAELEMTQQINWYMQGKFFIGKFPPLSSLICTFVARIAGYYGSEELVYSGQSFKHFPVTALRRVSSLLGTALIPLCYMTLRNMGHSRSTATLASALLVFENGIITQSRYILPEVYALFFSAAATCSWSFMNKYMQESNQESDFKSKVWNLVTGLCIGCSISSKWSGAMAIPVIWASIVYEMFTKLSEKKNNVMRVMKRFIGYVFTVGLLPLIVYYVIFRYHLSLIPNAGDHDLLLTSEFKYSLIGNEFEPTQPKVAYGSSLVIKHRHTGGGYLHSHKRHYTTGSKQQQVSTYPHVDVTNIWTIHKLKGLANTTAPIEYVKNHDRIRLEHFASSRKLHSHDHRAPISTRKEYFEVSAYGDRFIAADSNDFWTLNILDDTGNIIKEKDVIFRPLVHNFRLLHQRGCALVSVEAYLPETKQQEVACMNSAAKHVYSWVVESAMHPQEMDEPNVTIKTLDSNEKMREAHWLMYSYPKKVYNRLQDDTKNQVDGSPLSWFLKRYAVKIWSKLTSHSFMVINPALQRLTLASLASVIGFLGLRALYEKRQANIPTFFTMPKSSLIGSEGYIRSILFYYGATLIHTMLLSTVPSFSLSLADVLPSFYYGAGLVSVLLELSTLRLSPVARRTVTYSTILLSAFSFWRLSSLVYSNQMWTRTDCENARLGSIDCLDFTPSTLDDNSDMAIATYPLPYDKTDSLRYALGDEVTADQNIAAIRQKKYLQARDETTWIYHHAIPTPAMPNEEAAQWAGDIHRGAQKREENNRLEAKKKAAEEMKKKEEEEAKKKKEEEEKQAKEKKAKEKKKRQEAENSKLKAMTKAQQEKTKGSKKTALDNIKNKKPMPVTDVAEPIVNDAAESMS